jgi:hypothetical protein
VHLINSTHRRTDIRYCTADATFSVAETKVGMVAGTSLLLSLSLSVCVYVAVCFYVARAKPVIDLGTLQRLGRIIGVYLSSSPACSGFDICRARRCPRDGIYCR